MAEPTETGNERAARWGDLYIWGIYLSLIVISIIESYTASSREIASQGIYMPLIKQLIFLVMGAGLVVYISRMDYDSPKFLYSMIPGLALVTVISLVWVMFFGKEINDAQRAIYIAGVSFMPAELAKLSIVTLLAYILAKSQTGNGAGSKGVVMCGVAVAIYSGLLIKNGFSNTALLMGISIIMMLIGGVGLKRIVYIIMVYAVLGGIFMIIKHNNDSKEQALKAKQEQVMRDFEGNPITLPEGLDTIMPTDKNVSNWGRFGTVAARIDRWMNSEDLINQPIGSKNQQEQFSRMAIAHGGITGVGLGNSRECSRLPLAFSDYIFSIIIEETGLIGGCFVLLLYLGLLARAGIIVRRSRRILPALLIMGMASLITLQALIHIAINVGVFPVSGQPLPLISKGGTATLVMSIAFGVMLSVSRTITNYSAEGTKVETSTLPDGLDAENPYQLLPKNTWK